MVSVSLGELEVAGGNLYCENTIDDPDDDNWHPAVALNNNSLGTAVIRISGGEIDASSNAGYALAVTSAAGGKITITTNNPKLSATNAYYEAQASFVVVLLKSYTRRCL